MEISKLAVIDWGIGGFSFVSHFRKSFSTPILYISDSGFRPYGTCSKEVLHARLKHIFSWCFDQGASHIVVACNAASSVLERQPPNIVGVIAATVRRLRPLSLPNLHVIGGIQTIQSNAYGRQGLEYASASIAQPLSALIERGILEGEEWNSVLRDVLQPQAEHLLLACTHYEILSFAELATYMPNLSCIWKPSECTYDFLKEHHRFRLGKGEIEVYSTGVCAGMQNRVLRLFHVNAPPFQSIVL